MSSLPELVKVGSYYYSVSRNSDAVAAESEDSSAFGSSNYKKLTIKLRDDLHPDCEAATLLHEVLHCTLDSTGLHGHMEREMLIEDVIEVLCNQFLLVLRENPTLIEYLLTGEDEEE